MRPPRAEGWFAEDLDALPEAPRHTELIDGALVFMMSPQRIWHSLVVSALERELRRLKPPELRVYREITIRLDPRTRPEPEVVVTRTLAEDLDRTWLDAADVVLAVEVVSPESEHRDRTVKLRKYAEAGIPHYWLVDDEQGSPVAHVYELDTPTGAYAPAGIYRGALDRAVPFPVTLDLGALAIDG